MQPMISIVMPVYNAGEYLERAVGSVIGQSERRWELILVDDGSMDDSPSICDALAKEDARISVIHLPRNGGLSHARNVGMQKAQGQYLMFMDSDDWIENGLLSDLTERMGGKDAPQMIVWGVTEEHYSADGRLIETRQVCCPARKLTGCRSVRKAALELEQATLLGYAWNKLYEKDLLKNCGAAFETVPLIEDILFNLSVLGAVKRMETMDSAPYHYARRTDGSLTHRFLPYYYEQSVRRVSELLKLYAGWGMKEQAAQALAPIYARYVLSALERNHDPRSGMNAKKRREFIREVFESELYEELSEKLPSGGSLGKLFATKNAALCLLAGRAAHIIKGNAVGLFVKMSRQKRGEQGNEAVEHRSTQL